MGAARLIIFLCLPAALSAEFVLQKKVFFEADATFASSRVGLGAGPLVLFCCVIIGPLAPP